MSLKKFPKVRPLGHPETEPILEPGTVHVLEKMDGANFRWGVRDGDLIIGSRNHTYPVGDDNIPKAFRHAVEFVQNRFEGHEVVGDVTFFGEAMHPHTLEYDWDNTPSVLGFAMYDHKAERFDPWPIAKDAFESWDVPPVPHLDPIEPEDLSTEYPIPASGYRDGQPEGVVFWHENGTCAKLRTEAFKEKHKSPTSDAKGYDGHEKLVADYCTEPRIDKRINDLLDQGETLERSLMGEGLPQAVARDIFEEHAHEIVNENETVDLKAFRSLVAKRCLTRIDDRMAEEMGVSA